jgi:hypothetical protein
VQPERHSSLGRACGVASRSCESPYPDPGYVIEGFVLPRRLMSQIKLGSPRQSVVSLYHPAYQWRGGRIDLKIVDLPGQPIFLGFMGSRVEVDVQGAGSGFSLNSPSDMKHGLAAMYPAPKFDEEPAKALDWEGSTTP